MKLFKITIVLLCIILNIGCTNIKEKEIEESINDEQIRIGVLIYRFDDPFITSVKKTIEKQAEELNSNCAKEIILDIVDGKNQQELQKDQIHKFINEKYDVLAINLVDRSIAATVIDEAKQADIPIVFFNRQPVDVDMARWDKIYYVGADAEQSGLIQGKIVTDYWNKNTEADKNKDGIMQYVMLKGQPGHQDTLIRSQYSIKTIKDNNIMVEELVSDMANWQRKEAKEKMSTWLEIFHQKIEFVICNNDTMALGTVDAMKESSEYVSGEFIPVVGVDAIDSAINALNKGEIIGTVYNDYEEQGKIVVNMAYYLAMGLDPYYYIDGIIDGTYYWIPYKEVVKEP